MTPRTLRTSPYRGVSWREKDRIWQAYATVDGRMTRLGIFRSELTAARVYDAVAREFHGDRALLNFPHGVPSDARDRASPDVSLAQRRAAREQRNAEIARRYEQGECLRELGVAFGMTAQSVHEMLRARGVTMRPRGGDQTPAARNQKRRGRLRLARRALRYGGKRRRAAARRVAV